VPVDCDAYPYDTATNPLRNLLPRWVMEGGIPAMLERLGSREIRARIRNEIARTGLTNFGRIPSWDVVRVAISPHLPDQAGRTFEDIARRRGVDPIDAVADHVVADRGETRILITSMTDADVHEITRAPWITVGSDANALAVTGVTSQGKPHPRSYGAHARVLGPYVRDLRLLTLEAAVAKMTGVAARALGLMDRGRLRPGACADVTVFDPARIADRSTYEDPHRYAVGVSTVVVNGQVVIDGGDHTGAVPGRVLRRPAA
jgi:N-acyl-D-aspartate/D-glutamate deacylase